MLPTGEKPPHKKMLEDELSEAKLNEPIKRCGSTIAIIKKYFNANRKMRLLPSSRPVKHALLRIAGGYGPRISDSHSEDPGSNPGGSISFFETL